MHEKQWKVIYIVGPQFLPYTPEKFEIAALFLRLDLPCTLIRHENKPGEFKNACLAFQCERKKRKRRFLKMMHNVTIIVISLPEFSSLTKWQVIAI